MTAWHNLLWDSLDVIQQLLDAPEGQLDQQLRVDAANHVGALVRTLEGQPPRCEVCR